MASVTPVVDGFVLRKGSAFFFKTLNSLPSIYYQVSPILHYRCSFKLMHATSLLPQRNIGEASNWYLTSLLVAKRSAFSSTPLTYLWLISHCSRWIQVNYHNTHFDRIEYKEPQLPGALGPRRGNSTSGCKALQGFQNRAGTTSKNSFCYIFFLSI